MRRGGEGERVEEEGEQCAQEHPTRSHCGEDVRCRSVHEKSRFVIRRIQIIANRDETEEDDLTSFS